MNRAVRLAGALLALVSTPVGATCWTTSEVAAAKVRDLDTMLMVSSLRCRFQSEALLQTYNAMVVRHRAALTEANKLLQAHFSPAAGGASELDRYITRVANHYGAGAEDLSCESLQSIAEAALQEATTLPALEALADRAAVMPDLPGGSCDKPAYQVAALH